MDRTIRDLTEYILGPPGSPMARTIPAPKLAARGMAWSKAAMQFADAARGLAKTVRRQRF
jgi:hypothetical protein